MGQNITILKVRAFTHIIFLGIFLGIKLFKIFQKNFTKFVAFFQKVWYPILGGGNPAKKKEFLLYGKN